MAPNDRMRVPVEDAYVASIGRAIYVFATLEWNAVWCCEGMDKNYVRKLKRKTAGVVADDFLRFAARHPDLKIRADTLKAAQEFDRLVKKRNALAHAKPGTADGGAQRLFRHGTAWTVESINEAADEFAACSIVLNALMHGPLKRP